MKYEPLIGERFYHIYNRGNNSENIFIEKRNYSYFLELIKKHLLPVSEIYAYCLLKNHFHLLIKTKDKVDKVISNKFSNLFNAYAKAINKSYQRTGSLFQRSFSRKIIDNELYLRQLILYIHLNSQYHGFVEDFKKYPYSSYQSMLSNKPTALKRKRVIELFEDLNNFIEVHDMRKVNFENIEEEIYLE